MSRRAYSNGELIDKFIVALTPEVNSSMHCESNPVFLSRISVAERITLKKDGLTERIQEGLGDLD